MNDIMLSYDDICVIPEEVTTIESRKECDCYDRNGMLPIFASCMDTVCDLTNAKEYLDNKIYPIIPRTETYHDRLSVLKKSQVFVAFSLNESIDLFLKERAFENETPVYLCIDMANGHMKKLIDTVAEIKKRYGDNVIVMTGNIANPKTYRDFEDAGCDYIRCGIGGGSGCSTSSNTGIHYAYFSLIKEMYEIKKSMDGHCKIIADGNIRGYRDIQKALVYADYVMIGGLFNKALESSAKTTFGKSYFNIRGYKIFRPLKTLFTYGKEVPKDRYDKVARDIKKGKVVVWKKFYGMSTREAQKRINQALGKANAKTKTSEGLVKYQKVEYTLKGWTENETDYLRSAMSYTNSKTLNEYHDSEWKTINQIRYNN